jgi:hypothetical protein
MNAMNLGCGCGGEVQTVLTFERRRYDDEYKINIL